MRGERPTQSVAVRARSMSPKSLSFSSLLFLVFGGRRCIQIGPETQVHSSSLEMHNLHSPRASLLSSHVHKDRAFVPQENVATISSAKKKVIALILDPTPAPLFKASQGSILYSYIFPFLPSNADGTKCGRSKRFWCRNVCVRCASQAPALLKTQDLEVSKKR